MIRSPFFVIEDAISPAKCDLIIQQLGIRTPSRDEKGRPLKYERLITDAELVSYLQGPLQDSVGLLEDRFGGEIRDFETPLFQQYFENPATPAEPMGCENSRYIRKKWARVKNVDLVGYLWLKDYNSGVPLDPRFEVYGGKLEFPAYDCSLLPARGAMILFPAGPHFITATSPVLVGSLELVKVTLKIHTSDGSDWVYDPSAYPGSFTEWLSQEGE